MTTTPPRDTWAEDDDEYMVTGITASRDLPFQRDELGRLRLTRLADGRIMCTVHMDYVARSELYRDPADGKLVDICRACATTEGLP